MSMQIGRDCCPAHRDTNYHGNRAALERRLERWQSVRVPAMQRTAIVLAAKTPNTPMAASPARGLVALWPCGFVAGHQATRPPGFQATRTQCLKFLW